MESIKLVKGKADSEVSFDDAMENYRKNTDWWIIFDVFDLPDSKGSALWISTRTGIPVESVTEALEGLSVLGLLRQGPNGFEKAKTEITIPSGDHPKAQRIADHALISRQILNHLNEDAKGALRFASFVSNVEVISEMYEKINEAILEADRKSKSLPKAKLDNVYLTSFTTATSLPMKGRKGTSRG